MNRKMLIPLAAVLTIAVAVTFVAAFVVSPTATVAASGDGLEVLPIGGQYWGRTYDGWAEEWMKWWVAEPLSSNPMLDTTGEFCAEGQDGKVWFLTGCTGESCSVERHCTVPYDKALFFPVYNYFWLPWPSDPPLSDEEKASYEELFAWVIGDLMTGTATIDGQDVADLAGYRAATDWHQARIPEDDVIAYLSGYAEGTDWSTKGKVEPFYNDGVYLLVAPLEPGEHTIHLTHNWGMDVTYYLTVTADE